MSKNVKLIKLKYINDAIDVFMKNGEIDEFKDDVAEYNQKKKSFTKFLSFDRKGLSDYHKEVVSAVMETLSRLNVNILPHSDKINKQLDYHIRELASYFPELATDTEKLLKEAEKSTDKNVIEHLNKYKKIKTLSSLAKGGTAAIMPVFDSVREYNSNKTTRLIKYFTWITENLFDKILTTHSDESQRKTALTQVLEHEIIGHFYGDDISLDGGRRINEPYAANWSHSEKNAFNDLRINLNMHRDGNSRALEEVVSIVSPRTIGSFFGRDVALVDAFWKYTHNNLSMGELMAEIVKSIKKFTGRDVDIDELKSFIENVDFEETKKNLKKIKSLDELVNVDKKSFEVKTLMKNSSFTAAIDLNNVGHENWLDVVRQSGELYENGLTETHLKDFLGQTYNNYRNLIVSKGGGDGEDGEGPQVPGKGKGKDKSKDKPWFEDNIDNGKPVKPEDEDAYENVDEDEAKSMKEECDRDCVNKINDKMTSKKYSRKGNESLHDVLVEERDEYIERIIKSTLIDFGQLFMNTEEIARKLVLIPPSHLKPVVQKKLEEAKITGSPVIINVGQVMPTTVEVPLNGIVLAAIDESGSMDDSEVARAKTSLMRVCSAHKLGVLAVSSASDIFNGKFSFFLDGKTNPKDFNVRNRTGGTDSFHRLIFDFGRILDDKDHPMYKNLNDILTSLNIKNLNIDMIKNFYDNGRIAMMIITDGAIPTDKITNDRDFYEKVVSYSEKFKKSLQTTIPPVTYISVRDYCADPMNTGKNKFYRVYKRN